MDKATVKMLHPAFSDAQVDLFIECFKALKPILKAAENVPESMRPYVLTALNEQVVSIVRHQQ